MAVEEDKPKKAAFAAQTKSASSTSLYNIACAASPVTPLLALTPEDPLQAAKAATDTLWTLTDTLIGRRYKTSRKRDMISCLRS